MKLFKKDKLLLEPTHVDDFIDSYNTDSYASWFLMLSRLPASLQTKFEQYTKKYKLFCTYNGNRYRVTGASRLGDIWLAKDFDRDYGYDLRVDVGECTDFSPRP